MRITQDPELTAILHKYNQRKQIFVITHFNHPNEITDESKKAIQLLREAGVVVRNQTVLLRGINDHAEVMGLLMKRLTAVGVAPYYVFQCRPVAGVGTQFQVPIKEGYQIVEGAKRMQNGQGKAIRYIMSHRTGKIEIIGLDHNGDMIMKYHLTPLSDFGEFLF